MSLNQRESWFDKEESKQVRDWAGSEAGGCRVAEWGEEAR